MQRELLVARSVDTAAIPAGAVIAGAIITSTVVALWVVASAVETLRVVAGPIETRGVITKAVETGAVITGLVETLLIVVAHNRVPADVVGRPPSKHHARHCQTAALALTAMTHRTILRHSLRLTG